jgi:hypothetical protein
MSDTLTVDASIERAKSSEDEVKTSSDSQSWSFVSEHVPRSVPLFIPRDQAYYWSHEWQRSVRETYMELKAGEYMDFDDPNDPDAVVRWLSSDEEDE